MDCLITGTTVGIINYFKDKSLKEINKINIMNNSFDCSAIEKIQTEVNYILDLLNGIYQDLITNVITDNTIIKIKFNKNKYEYIIVGRKGE